MTDSFQKRYLKLSDANKFTIIFEWQFVVFMKTIVLAIHFIKTACNNDSITESLKYY